MRYDQVHDEEWVRPVRRGFKTKCCRCGLVHIWNFKLVNKKKQKAIEFQITRLRRKKG